MAFGTELRRTPTSGLFGAFQRAALDRALRAALGPDFEARIEAVPLHLGSSGVDPFGLDPEWTKYALAGAAILHRRYFRTEVFGAELVPRGRLLLIANHSGQVPFDAMILGATMFLDVNPPRFIRAMVEKWTQTLPFVSTLFPRVGQVVGVPENARRLLEQDEALLVFPEGSRGISKPFSKRYQLTEFGLGFMRLAIETKTPIVPVAVVGAEEQYVSLANLDRVARFFQMPSAPLLPQLLLPFGAMPLPVRYRLHFGAPMSFDGDADDDDAIIEAKVARVRGVIQSMVNRGVHERKGIFF